MHEETLNLSGEVRASTEFQELEGHHVVVFVFHFPHFPFSHHVLLALFSLHLGTLLLLFHLASFLPGLELVQEFLLFLEFSSSGTVLLAPFKVSLIVFLTLHVVPVISFSGCFGSLGSPALSLVHHLHHVHHVLHHFHVV